MIGYHLTVLHYTLYDSFLCFLSSPSSTLIPPAPFIPYITVVLKSCTIKKLYCHCRLPLLLPTVAARKEKLSPTLHTGR